MKKHIKATILSVLFVILPITAFAWIDTNDWFLYHATGPKQKDVAVIENPGTITGTCVKTGGIEVEWVEFEFDYITVPSGGPGSLKVSLQAITAGPYPREATCSLYENNLMIEDWVVKVQ